MFVFLTSSCCHFFPQFQRQETLLVEYKNKRKVNKVIDMRIGEKNTDLNNESVMLERFARVNKVLK